MFFADELVVLSKKRALDLCEKIAPLEITWNCQGRINIMDEELLIAMKKAGCTAIGYGVESGSQEILDQMKKMIKVEEAIKIINLTKKVGITPVLQFIFGYPGENRKTIEETIDSFNKVDEPNIEFSPLTPLPGTKIWQDALRKNIISDEKVFLERLEGGYMPDAPTLVNFTSFPDEKLEHIRKQIENKIRLNYIKKHPFYVVIKIKEKIFT